MTNDQCIAGSLPSIPAPELADLLLLHFRIFLYRAADDRPHSDFRFPGPEPPDFLPPLLHPTSETPTPASNLAATTNGPSPP